MNSTDHGADDDLRERQRVQREAQPGTEPHADQHPGQQGAAQEQAQQRGAGRRRTSTASMVISLAVVLGVVVTVLGLVTRVSQVTQPPVDVAAGARAAAERVEFTPSVPGSLPAEFRPTSVRTTVATAQVVTWHAGYVISGKRYAALEQGKDAPGEWLRAQTNRGRPDGTQDVGGVSWQRVLRTDKVQNSLVHVRGPVTTIVTGTASYDELAVLAAALQPAG